MRPLYRLELARNEHAYIISYVRYRNRLIGNVHKLNMLPWWTHEAAWAWRKEYEHLGNRTIHRGEGVLCCHTL